MIYCHDASTHLNSQFKFLENSYLALFIAEIKWERWFNYYYYCCYCCCCIYNLLSLQVGSWWRTKFTNKSNNYQ